MSSIEPKDLYQILVDTRNLEINLFWERSNYFLVLNTAIAFGVFNVPDPKYVIIFAMLGLLSSILWFWVCLGGKYWQTRWEQRLMDFEADKLSGLEFFSAGQERLDEDVRRGLDFHKPKHFKKLVYGMVLRRKPSVSFSMIVLALSFVVAWILIIAVVILTWVHGGTIPLAE